jgi:hypothetical protein
LRQHLRLLMVMLPPQKSEKLALAQMEQAGRQLRALRCDGWVYARRARLLLRSKRRSALVIDSLEGGRRDQVVDFLDASEPRWHLREQFLEDDLTRALLDRVTR